MSNNNNNHLIIINQNPAAVEISVLIEFTLLFISGGIGALFPALAVASGSTRSAVWLTFGNAFAGGVMLSVALVHLLADAVEASTTTTMISNNNNNNITSVIIIPRSSFILCVAGIILPFSVEKGGLLVFLMSHKNNINNNNNTTEKDDTPPPHHSHRHNDDHIEDDHPVAVAVAAATATTTTKPVTNHYYGTIRSSPSSLKKPSMDDAQSDSSNYSHSTLCIMPALVSTKLQARLDFLRSSDFKHELDVVPHALTIVPKQHAHDEMLTDDAPTNQLSSSSSNNNPFYNEVSPPLFTRLPSTATTSSPIHLSPQLHQYHSSHNTDTINITNNKHTHFSSSWFLLSTVLIIHSLLAGFCLGIQPAQNRIPLFFALVFHKLFESMAMGIASSKQPLGMSRSIQLGIFILADPIALLIGRSYYLSSDTPSTQQRGYLLSLCAGTFLYASLCEVLQEEFMDSSHRIQKFLVFSSGAIIMWFL
jgi:zinc transporter ZupT